MGHLYRVHRASTGPLTMAPTGPDGAAGEGRPWGRALVWLVGLGVFFYTSYGLANWLAGQRESVPSIVFGWEHRIPFLAWTIIPYWSVNLFYAASLFVCRTRAELRTHARRLLTAQVIAVIFFIATPLTFSFAQPATDGIPGYFFTALQSFDRPYNQAPSLHIALLVILWALYGRHVPSALRGLLHAWFALVGLSVLTTYQHHFIDIPAGALLGLLCLWVWPVGRPSPLIDRPAGTDRARLRMAASYGAGAVIIALAGLWLGGLGLWLLYPAVSLVVVAFNYALLGPDGFEKDTDGAMRPAARWLLAPYLLGAWLNSRAWTAGQPASCEIAEGVWLGRFPDRKILSADRFGTVVDLTAELPAPAQRPNWYCVPLLDLVAAEPEALRAAARRIEQARSAGHVLVVCALGYTRGASAVAVWLVSSGRAADIDQAIVTIQRKRPMVRLAHRREQLQMAIDNRAVPS